MRKPKGNLPDDIWDTLAEEHYRSKASSCWNCGGWYIKHAYLEGYKAGLRQAHLEAKDELQNEVDYPFDELQAWIDGVTTHKNKD